MFVDVRKARFWHALAVWSASALLCSGAQNVMLAWLPSPSQVAGYRLYYGTASGVYTSRVDVGPNTSFTVTGLTAGQTYYFSATSYAANGTESAYAPEVSFIAPGMLKLSQTSSNGVHTMRVQFPVAPSHRFTVQGSTNLISWFNLWVTPTQVTNGWVEYDETVTNTVKSRFYRLVIN
jgi:hypothetical protein